MEMIKEKVMRAWARDLKVTVCFGMDSELTGYVSEWVSHAFEIRDSVRYTEKGVRRFYYHDVTDIHFAGSEAEYPSQDASSEQRGWGMGSKGLYVLNDDGGMTLLATASFSAAPELRDALVALRDEYASNDEKTLSSVINDKVWQQIMDALKKSGG